MDFWMHGSWMWLWWLLGLAALIAIVWLIARSTAESDVRRSRGMMLVTDPVCDMTFDIDSAVDRTDYQGETYYFCAHACRQQFDRDPEKYVASA